MDYHRFYDLEGYLFSEVNTRFHADGSIGAFDFFAIVMWKANRAKPLVARRMLKRAANLEEAARKLTNALFKAQGPRARLEVLMVEWGFLLPMASAILTVLWPDDFSVYDRRVCDQLNDFEWVANRAPRRTWDGYIAFRDAVVAAAPPHLSLRDKDRYLWGRSNAEQLAKDLERGWPNKARRVIARRSSPVS